MASIDTNYNGLTDLKDFWPKTKSNFEAINTEQEAIKSGSIAAGKAISDENGNNIPATYATKSEVELVVKSDTEPAGMNVVLWIDTSDAT